MKRLLILSLLIPSCVSPAIILRDFSERVYYPCKPWQTKEPKGKFCYHYCKRYKLFKDQISENCVVWMNDIIDSKIDEDWNNIEKANFKLSK